ncbi:MAG: hypothetical protein HC902_15025 [Calothrix sp. SM1_5_4]|nr:hypothetical protein [Calothrix sp. SM1_5_4]
MREHFCRPSPFRESSARFARSSADLLFDGGSVFAFAEDPRNRLTRVEILETDPDTYAISMREIVFTESGPRFHAEPKACAACHGNPAKPLWDPYDFWPNAFAGAVGMVHTRQEAESYRTLIDGRGGSPLGRRLSWKQSLGLLNEENTPFTQYIQQINFGRWVRSALKDKDLSGIRFPLLGVLNGCGYGTDLKEKKVNLLSLFPQHPSTDQLDKIYSDIVMARGHFKSFQDRMVTVFFPSPRICSRRTISVSPRRAPISR